MKRELKQEADRYTSISAGELKVTIQDERLSSRERNKQTLELAKETKKLFDKELQK